MSGHIQRTKPSRNYPKGGWEARYRADVGGRKKWRAKTFGTKREAERFLAETVTDIHRGEYIDRSAQRTTFREVAEAWLESRHTLRPKTLAGYRWTLDKRLYPEWGDVEVGTIDYAAVQGWVNRMSRGHSPQTLMGAYRVLRMVLGHGVKLRKLRSNPADRNVELPKPDQREMEFLTHEEVERLAQAITDRPPVLRKDGTPSNYVTRLHRPELGLYVRFAAYTGLRAGEIGALRVRHLDFSEGTVSIEEAVTEVNGRLVTGPPKTRNGVRVVGIDQWLVDELRSHLGDRRLNPEAYVFIGQHGAQWNHGNFRGRYWREATRRTGLSDRLRFHDLRHTYASFLIESNVHVAEMSRLLGHASVSITIDVYGHILPTQTAETAAKLGIARTAALSLVS